MISIQWSLLPASYFVEAFFFYKFKEINKIIWYYIQSKEQQAGTSLKPLCENCIFIQSNFCISIHSNKTSTNTYNYWREIMPVHILILHITSNKNWYNKYIWQFVYTGCIKRISTVYFHELLVVLKIFCSIIHSC